MRWWTKLEHKLEQNVFLLAVLEKNFSQFDICTSCTHILTPLQNLICWYFKPVVQGARWWRSSEIFIHNTYFDFTALSAVQFLAYAFANLCSSFSTQNRHACFLSVFAINMHIQVYKTQKWLICLKYTFISL